MNANRHGGQIQLAERWPIDHRSECIGHRRTITKVQGHNRLPIRERINHLDLHGSMEQRACAPTECIHQLVTSVAEYAVKGAVQ